MAATTPSARRVTLNLSEATARNDDASSESVEIGTPLLERQTSYMQDVRERIGRLQEAVSVWDHTNPTLQVVDASGGREKRPSNEGIALMAVAGSAKSQDALRKRNANFAPSEEVKRRCPVSVVTVILCAISTSVLVACACMFVPLELSLQRIRYETTETSTDASQVQQLLIDSLLFSTLTQGVIYSLLDTVSRELGSSLLQPADRAVDEVWGLMKTQHRANPTWTGDLQEIAASTRVAVDGDYGLFGAGGQVGHRAVSVFAAFSNGEYAGCSLPHLNSTTPVGCKVNSGTIPNDALRNVSRRTAAMGAPTPKEKQFHADVSWPFPISAALAAQDLLAEDPAAPVTRAWSRLESQGLESFVRTVLTAPITYCGSYSCYRGVVAAEMALATLGRACQEALANFKKALGPQVSSVSLTDETWTMFLVVQASLFPDQQGLLIASSDSSRTLVPAASSFGLIQTTSMALLKRFGSWAQVPGSDNMARLTYHFQTSMPEELSNSTACARGVSRDGDCTEVGWLSIKMDPHTTWLLVFALPSHIFGAAGEVARQTVSAEVEHLETASRRTIFAARFCVATILTAMGLASISLSQKLGNSVTRHLQRLNYLLRQLCGMDFKGKAVLQELNHCKKVRLVDLRRLQFAFCRLAMSLETFARFVPETVVRNIVHGNLRATRLHVTQRVVTVVCSDIAGFTTITESLTQRDLLFILTRYYSVMTRLIEMYEGIVSEILGDGLIAFWNAPDLVRDHPSKAAAAALGQLQALTLLNMELHSLDLPQLTVRIGIHTGNASIGNIGSEARMKFGCLGEPIQLAGKLEELCKHYGAGIICSGATQSQLPEEAAFLTRKLDLIQVHFQPEPTWIYEIISRDFALANQNADAILSAQLGSGTPCLGSSNSDSFVRLQSSTAVVQQAIRGSTESLTSLDSSIWLALGQERQMEPGPIESTDSRIPSHFRHWLSQPASGSSTTINSGPSYMQSQATDSLYPTPTQETLSPLEPSPTSMIWNSGNMANRPSKDVVTPEQRRLVAAYEVALQAYQEGRFEDAYREATLIAEETNDAASIKLAERCRHYVDSEGCDRNILTPQERDLWTGVVHMNGF